MSRKANERHGMSIFARYHHSRPPRYHHRRHPLVPPPGGGGTFEARRLERARNEGVGRKITGNPLPRRYSFSYPERRLSFVKRRIEISSRPRTTPRHAMRMMGRYRMSGTRRGEYETPYETDSTRRGARRWMKRNTNSQRADDGTRRLCRCRDVLRVCIYGFSYRGIL